MKSLLRIVILLPMVFMLACNTVKSNQDDFKKINWLLGSWDRVNVKADRTANERWEIVSDQEFKGWGVSMTGVDTTFIEKLWIVSKEGSLYYVADVPENPNPVYFKFTSISENGFVCENSAHHFPKKIEYKLKLDTLLVITSGDGKELAFPFIRSRIP